MWPFKKKKFLKAIVVYPNKKVEMLKVDSNAPTFEITKDGMSNNFVIDPKAIHFFNEEPLLFYNAQHASPIVLSENGTLLASMSSAEFRSVIKSSAIRDLLTAATGGGWDIQFIMIAVAAVASVLSLVASGGLSGIIPGFGG